MISGDTQWISVVQTLLSWAIIHGMDAKQQCWLEGAYLACSASFSPIPATVRATVSCEGWAATQ